MNLRRARHRARLTQRELSERSGVDESTICLIESAKRSYATVGYAKIVKLARGLGVDPVLLFPVPDPKRPKRPKRSAGTAPVSA